MRYLRVLIYKWGFRPKSGSIFFSPSLHYMIIARQVREEQRKIGDWFNGKGEE